MTVTIGALRNPEAGGTVRVVGPATKDASPGDTVTFEVEATPNPGYVFVIWGTESTQATFANSRASLTTVSYVVPPGAGPSALFYVTAYFGPEGGGDDPSGLMGTLELTTVPNNARWGTTTPSSVTKHGLTPPQHFSQRIVATPNFGYRFKHWELNGLTLDSTRYPADTTYAENFPNGYKRKLNFVAVFEPVEIHVDLYTSVGGGNGTTTPTHETKVAKFGVPVTFDIKATPLFGWRFLRWTETTSTGVGGSTNAERTISYTPNDVHDVEIRMLAYFGSYPSPGPKPPDYPGPVPDDPEDDGKPAIDISTYVSPQEAANVGATTYPIFQRKTGNAGEYASFTIEAYPQRAGDQTPTPYNFDHWEDGEGKIVSRDRIYTFTKKFPSSGVDSYGYTAVYVPEQPQPGYRSLHVWSGVGRTQAISGQKPSEGDVMLGYGVVEGGGLTLTSDQHGNGVGGYVDVESYVAGIVVIDYQKYPVFKEVKFPSVTARNPSNGYCRFVRWEGREYTGQWETITTDETVTHEMLVAKFPDHFWGLDGSDAGKWKLWYGSVQNSHSNSIELRAVFEIARMVIIGRGNSYPTDELNCARRSDGDGVLSDTGFHASGYVLFPLFPGGAVFIPFVNDDGESDPPNGHIHSEYSIGLSAPHEAADSNKVFKSTKHYRGISFTAPSDTSDFVVDPYAGNFANDRENGWQIRRAILFYHKLTGMPIADYDPDTGAGSGKLLHNAAGQLICDDSACPLEPTT